MDDDEREFVRRVFDPKDAPPPDIVPGSGLTLDDLRAQSDAAGTWRQVTPAPEPIIGVDGQLIGMTKPEPVAVYCGGTVISETQMTGLGLTRDDIAADYPGITVMPTPEKGSTHD